MRKILLSLTVLCGLSLTVFIGFNKIKTGEKRSFSPLIQLTGKGTKTLDRLVTKVIPIDELDERDLGKIYKANYAHLMKGNEEEAVYINSIINGLEKFSKKKFKYKGFVSSSLSPNAFALPGGVIVVTKGLLRTITNEAQLVSIIGHELGHIELGHCFDAVRFQLFSIKLGSKNLGKIADHSYNILVNHSFNKALENEADDYAYKIITQSPYAPSQMGKAFQNLQKHGQAYSYSEPSIFRDYFSSHPPLSQRSKKFLAQAKSWRNDHEGEKRYLGSRNLVDLKSYYSRFQFKDEWE